MEPFIRTSFVRKGKILKVSVQKGQPGGAKEAGEEKAEIIIMIIFPGASLVGQYISIPSVILEAPDIVSNTSR